MTHWGIFDKQDNCWLSDVFDDFMIARIAAQGMEDQLYGSDLGGRLVAMELNSENLRLKDEVWTQRTALESLRRSDGGEIGMMSDLEIVGLEQRIARLTEENARLRAENAEIAAVKTRELLPFTSSYMNAVEAERDALATRCRVLEAALVKLFTWPASYPATANIERMRDYAGNAITASAAKEYETPTT